jgi:hypothetical protein
MEIVVQWLDELDDLYAAVLLISERIRNVVVALLVLLMYLLAPAAGILLALRHPPLAMATAMLLFVTLLYRSVTTQRFSPGT